MSIDPINLSTWCELTQFARSAEAGDYLITYPTPDPSDIEIAEVNRILVKRDLRLTTDDIGILVTG